MKKSDLPAGVFDDELSGLRKALATSYECGSLTHRRLPKVHFTGDGTLIVRTPGRQVLRPGTRKAARHPWAHERDSNGRVVPLVPGGGPLPHDERVAR